MFMKEPASYHALNKISIAPAVLTNLFDKIYSISSRKLVNDWHPYWRGSTISMLAKPKGFLRVSHYVSVYIFKGVDEELGPLLPVFSLAEFGSLGSVCHGCNAKPVLLLAQAVQQDGHTLQGGGNQ